MLKIPYFKQNRDYSCGPVCLRMVLAFYRINQDEVTLSIMCQTNLFGTAARDIARVANQLGLEARTAYFEQLSTIRESLADQNPVLTVVDLGQLYEREEYKHARHMVVVSEIADKLIRFHDPLMGANMSLDTALFERAWNAAKGEAIFIWQAK